MRTRRAVGIIALIAASAGIVSAQETGFLKRSISIDGTEYPYQVYVPPEFQRANPSPIILALHGGGSYGRDGLRQTENGIASTILLLAIGLAIGIPSALALGRYVSTQLYGIQPHDPQIAIWTMVLLAVVFAVAGLIPGHRASRIEPILRSHPDRVRSIVVFPQSPPGTVWGQPLSERIALTELDKAIAEFNADASREYLTGISGGGYGAWSLAYHHPDRFAALIVDCGYVREMTGVVSGEHYPAIAPGADPYATIAQRLSRLPIWIFHGDADRVVPVEESRRMAAALKAIGADVQYTELAGEGHAACLEPAYDRAELFTWLFEQKRR
jgi:poly(3-hydroxybutyrate) depolymerase